MQTPNYQDIVHDEALIVSVVSEDFPLHPAGQRWVADKSSGSDTLNVFRGRDGVMRYKRFGTDQGGTVFEYLKDYRGVHDRAEALRALGYGDQPRPPSRRRLLTQTRPAQAPEPPQDWKLNPGRYLREYRARPDRYRLWQQYRPFSKVTIDQWKLGVGVLPMYRNEHGRLVNPGGCGHPRLILPVLISGEIKGFRGRVMPGVCECRKWVGVKAGEAALFGSDLIRCGLETIVTEAPVSVIFGMQERDDVNIVAGTAGAGTWQDDWTNAIVKGRPPQVVVWYDNDLAGNPNRDTYEHEARVWRDKWAAKHPDRPAARVPAPNGPRVAERLRAAGLYVITHTWPSGTLVNADFDAWLMDRMQAA